MDFTFPVCHLFYYPTQVILVDDDPDFLDAVSLVLPRNLSYRLFQSPREALNYINAAHQHADIIRRVYSSYKTGPFDSDTLTHIEINEIYREIYNPERFSTPTVVVVDYSMPSMNGLELCASLTNPYIKRILLTGQADTDLAVQAFNEGLIDQFISKKDQDLDAKLTRSIATLQQHYFSKSFKLITDPVIANRQCRFINNPDFISYFNAVRKRMRIVEYYLIDEPYSGFVMLNEEGALSILLIMPQDRLHENLQQCQRLGLDQTLCEHINKGEMIPLFNIADDDAHLRELLQTDWKKYYTPAHWVSPESGYYCAVLEQENVNRLVRSFVADKIHSYKNFLQTPAAPGAKFLH